MQTVVTTGNSVLPLQLVRSPYGYAALLDAEGNEQPITDSMIRQACEEAHDALCGLLVTHDIKKASCEAFSVR